MWPKHNLINFKVSKFKFHVDILFMLEKICNGNPISTILPRGQFSVNRNMLLKVFLSCIQSSLRGWLADLLRFCQDVLRLPRHDGFILLFQILPFAFLMKNCGDSRSKGKYDPGLFYLSWSLKVDNFSSKLLHEV